MDEIEKRARGLLDAEYERHGVLNAVDPVESVVDRAAVAAIAAALRMGGERVDTSTNEAWIARAEVKLDAKPEAVAEADREEDAYVIKRACGLLAQIAIIVNGPEPPLTRWSYHDLPEKVQALKNAHPAAAVDEATDTQRLDWIESQIACYGDGYTEPREAGWCVQWQQGRQNEYWPGLRAWLDGEMKREDEFTAAQGDGRG